MMDDIRAFFPKIRATFSIFKKRQGRSPPLPPSCAPGFLFILMNAISKTKMKRYADKGSPCLVPLSNLN